MSKWRKWRELSGADRWLLMQAGVLLVHARIKLRSVEFRPDTSKPKRSDAASTPPPDVDRARAVAHLVRIASAHAPVAFTCLHRALATWRLLRRIGIPCDLRLGACAGGDPFEAHAWVECAGVALEADPASLARYRSFPGAVVPVARRRLRPAPGSISGR